MEIRNEQKFKRMNNNTRFGFSKLLLNAVGTRTCGERDKGALAAFCCFQKFERTACHQIKSRRLVLYSSLTSLPTVKRTLKRAFSFSSIAGCRVSLPPRSAYYCTQRNCLQNQNYYYPPPRKPLELNEPWGIIFLVT